MYRRQLFICTTRLIDFVYIGVLIWTYLSRDCMGLFAPGPIWQTEVRFECAVRGLYAVYGSRLRLDIQNEYA
jgi:hypothetical protein